MWVSYPWAWSTVKAISCPSRSWFWWGWTQCLTCWPTLLPVWLHSQCGCGVCGGGGVGCGGCRGMPGEALLGPDTFSHFPLLPTHPPTQPGCSNSSSRHQPNGCAASEPQKHRQHGMCTMALREQRKSGWPPGTGALPHTLGPVSATGPGPDQGRVCQEVLSCHWPAPQSGQPDSGWAAAVAASCHHWRRGQLWHWPMTMRKQQHGTLLGVTWPFTKNQGPRRRRGRNLVGLVLDRGWWYCWGILWTAAT